MKLSIIIPTINRYSDLKNTIKYLSNQTVQDFEIIIIDQTDIDKNENLEYLDHRIKYLHSEIKSASAARNIGIKSAANDILLFLDDDIIINDKYYLSNFISNYSQGSAGVVGPILNIENQVFKQTRSRLSYNKYWGWLFFPRNYGLKCNINDGGAGNLSVIRANALSIGGMDENYIKGAHREESDFNLRYTQKFGSYVFDPKCSLIHIGRISGGVRSWNDSSSVKAQHHFDGALYFIFKNVKLWHYPPHFLSLFIFFYYKRDFLKNPLLAFKTTGRFLIGIKNAIALLRKGPKYLSI